MFSKAVDFLTATEFVYSNDAETILIRTRMAAALLTLLLALLVFALAKEMFGTVPAFVALVRLVFEPNMVAHGAVVATDVGMSCFLLATVYTFYRCAKKPSVVRLMLTGVAVGMALATKHSAILVFPILAVLAICEIVFHRGDAVAADRKSWTSQAVRFAGSIAAVGVIAIAVLWAFYGFHFRPPPRARDFCLRRAL